MDNNEAKYIERIEIKGLWGRYDVDWTLNPDVNILVGENGTGKSTILQLIYTMFRNLSNIDFSKSFPKEELFNEKEKFESFKLSFGENHWLAFKKINNDNFQLFGSEKAQQRKNDTIIEKDKRLKVDMLNTFEGFTGADYKNEIHNIKPNNTHLDIILKDLINEYIEYQLDLNKKIVNDKQDPNKVFQNWVIFKKTINQLFEKTNKRIDENENRISFILENGNKISMDQLSSGEKQVLIILLTVLCQDKNPSIFLMDEPELSLHISWQYELIKIIRELNPNCQLIIVTHSTSMFTKGWNDKLFFTTGNNPILRPIAEKV